MQVLRPLRRGTPLRYRLVLALALFVLPLSTLPVLYHYVSCPLQSPPDCQICLHGFSASDAPESIAAIAAPLEPFGVIFAQGSPGFESVPSGPHGGRSPPALG